MNYDNWKTTPPDIDIDEKTYDKALSRAIESLYAYELMGVIEIRRVILRVYENELTAFAKANGFDDAEEASDDFFGEEGAEVVLKHPEILEVSQGFLDNLAAGYCEEDTYGEYDDYDR